MIEDLFVEGEAGDIPAIYMGEFLLLFQDIGADFFDLKSVLLGNFQEDID